MCNFFLFIHLDRCVQVLLDSALNDVVGNKEIYPSKSYLLLELN